MSHRTAQPKLRPLNDKTRPQYKWRVYYNRGDGRRTATVFKVKQDALNFMEDKVAETENVGIEVAAKIDNSLKRRLYAALERLEPYEANLEDAVDHYIEFLKSTTSSEPVSELIECFMEDMTRAKKSKRYLIDLEHRLLKFSEKYGEAYASHITPKMAQVWLNRLQVGDMTKNNYRRVLSAFFAWCLRQGYVTENPIEKTYKTKGPVYDVQIYTVDELKWWLKEAAKEKGTKDILATIAIGAFAGLRTAEIERLTWEEVKLERGHIELKASKTKTASRRLVEIRPVLEWWLNKHFKNATGPIQTKNYSNRVRKFRARLKKEDKKKKRPALPWHHNALRHSFASYLLSDTDDAAKTALQLGHSDTAVLFQHYREVVTKEEAADYWQLHPKR